MGSDFGILEVDRRGGREGLELYGDRGGMVARWPGVVKDMSLSLRGDSVSDLMGELESVCLGLKVPASLPALEPPLRTELLAPEDAGLSGDRSSRILTGELGVGDEEDPSWWLLESDS